MFAGGTKTDTLVAKGRAAYGQNNGLHVALQPDGSLTSWLVETPAPTPTPEPDDSTQPQPDPVAPDTAAPQAG